MGQINRERVSELFVTALELRPGDRAAFLDVECGGETALRAEVESLLAASEDAGGFLDRPAELRVTSANFPIPFYSKFTTPSKRSPGRPRPASCCCRGPCDFSTN